MEKLIQEIVKQAFNPDPPQRVLKSVLPKVKPAEKKDPAPSSAAPKEKPTMSLTRLRKYLTDVNKPEMTHKQFFDATGAKELPVYKKIIAEGFEDTSYLTDRRVFGIEKRILEFTSTFKPVRKYFIEAIGKLEYGYWSNSLKKFVRYPIKKLMAFKTAEDWEQGMEIVLAEMKKFKEINKDQIEEHKQMEAEKEKKNNDQNLSKMASDIPNVMKVKETLWLAVEQPGKPGDEQPRGKTLGWQTTKPEFNNGIIEKGSFLFKKGPVEDFINYSMITPNISYIMSGPEFSSDEITKFLKEHIFLDLDE